jgi:hypothetical protein
MQEKKEYVADDGTVFINPFECAAYEFTTFPDKLDAFNRVLNKRPDTHQLVWCGANRNNLTEGVRSGGGGCACMGCCNHYVYDAGFTFYHWAVWYNSLDASQKITDDDGYHDKFMLVLSEMPETKAKIKGAAFMRNFLRNSHQEALALFKEPGSILFQKYYFAHEDLVRVQQELAEIGVKTHIAEPELRFVKAENIKVPVPNVSDDNDNKNGNGNSKTIKIKVI